MLIATVTWFTTGRKNFTGPPGAVIVGTVQSQHVEEEATEGSGVEEIKANMK